MIQSKSDLKEYLKKDKFALGITRKRPALIGDDLWKYEIVLRKHEYYLNTGKNFILKYFYSYFHYKKGQSLGFEIPCNVFGAGLRINHHGLIVVNARAKAGKFCELNQGVNIGVNIDGGVPTIGNNVWIGPGAKLFGNIYIADDIMIGANSVVNKSFPISGVTIAGVPAKVISNHGNVYKRADRYTESD